MKKIIGIFLVALFNLSFAYAQESSFDFKGIALKSDISMIEKDSKFICRDPQSPIADISCTLKSNEQETIAGAPIESFTLFYYNGKLDMISIKFKENYFSDVAEALTTKYGMVTPKINILKNRMGASFENKTYRWRKGDAVLQAERYSSDLKTSSVRFNTDYALEEFTRRRNATIKKKVGDL